MLSCNAVKNTSNSISFTELNYGLYRADVMYETDNETSPSGKHTVSNNVVFYEKTTNVKLKNDARFGAEFILNSDSYESIEIDIIWTYPKSIQNDKGENFSQLKKTSWKKANQKEWVGYVINREYEMVEGVWTLEIYHEEKRLYQKKFNVE